jgi:hypothetical protein
MQDGDEGENWGSGEGDDWGSDEGGETDWGDFEEEDGTTDPAVQGSCNNQQFLDKNIADMREDQDVRVWMERERLEAKGGPSILQQLHDEEQDQEEKRAAQEEKNAQEREVQKQIRDELQRPRTKNDLFDWERKDYDKILKIVKIEDLRHAFRENGLPTYKWGNNKESFLVAFLIWQRTLVGDEHACHTYKMGDCGKCTRLFPGPVQSQCEAPCASRNNERCLRFKRDGKLTCFSHRRHASDLSRLQGSLLEYIARLASIRPQVLRAGLIPAATHQRQVRLADRAEREQKKGSDKRPRK